MIFDSLMSITTIFELLIFFLLYLIFPFIFLIILVICFCSYLGYHILIIMKTSKSNSNSIGISSVPIGQGDNEGETMKAAYYSNSFSKIIDFGNYLKPILTGGDDLLIKVYSAALNPVDYKFQFSKIPFYRWIIFPDLGIGKEFSGIVIKTGPKVTKFKEGDEVYGFSSTGALQEFCLTKEKWIKLKPDNLSFSQAAGIPLAAGTSYQALSWFFSSNNNAEYNYNEVDLNGKVVLIIGASGGTGHFACQIARYLGAQEVYGVCSQANVELIRNLGCCDDVFAYDQEGFEQTLENNFKSSLGENKLDLIIDTVSSYKDGNVGGGYLKFLKNSTEGGRYVALGSSNPFRTMLGTFCSFFPKLNFEKNGEHVHFLNRSDGKTLDEINKMAVQGRLTPLVSSLYFEQNAIDDAITQLKSRRVRGKLVCNINSE